MVDMNNFKIYHAKVAHVQHMCYFLGALPLNKKTRKYKEVCDGRTGTARINAKETDPYAAGHDQKS